MNSVVDLLACDPRPSWQECVAIVQEAAARLAPGQPLPAAEDLLLEPDGTLTFGFAGESTEPQSADLASLLLTLLEGCDAPEGLRDLARHARTPEAATEPIEAFTRALARYERPNRPGDLQVMARRLEARSRRALADEELARLRDRLATETRPAAEKVPVLATRIRTRIPRKAVLRAAAAAGALAVVTAAGLVVWWIAARPVASVEARPRAAQVLPGDDLAAPAVAGPSGSGGPSGTANVRAARPRALAPVARNAAAVRRPVPEQRATAPASRATGLLPEPGRRADPVLVAVSHPSVPPVGLRVAPVDRAHPRPAPSAAGDVPSAHPAAPAPPTVTVVPLDPSAVYSNADAGVQPPTWLHQQLPTEPAPDRLTGFFEFIVDTDGNVEDLRLISAAQRYQERMLMAAAKAWKFRPALRDGRPVKYRMRVPVTLQWPLR